MAANTKKDETVKVETVETAQVELQGTETTVAEASVITDAQCLEDAKKWGAALAKEPKRTIKIKGKNSKDKEPVPVGVNGYFYFINKNESVEVPESVAKILEEADYI